MLYDRDKRYAGETHYTLKNVLKPGGGTAFFPSLLKPLKAIAGRAFCSLAAAGMTLLTLLILPRCGAPGGLWRLAMLMTGLTGGVLTAWGVLGEYVARIYDEARKRPL